MSDLRPLNFSKLDDRGRPICVNCDKPLRKVARSLHWKVNSKTVQSYGFEGNALFCTMRCGFDWAVQKAAAGTEGP